MGATASRSAPPRAAEVAVVFSGLLLVGVIRWLPALIGTQEFYAEDIPVLNLPVRAYFGHNLHAGVLTLWTPLLQTGFPLFAESQGGFTYPLRALHALSVPAEMVLAWTIVLHFAWAGAGLYLYLRLTGVRRGAALIPAVAFAFSPLLVVRHQHTNVLEALAWWPWLLAGVERGLQRDGLRPWIWTGVAGGMLCACGHVQYVVYGFYLAGLYLLVRSLTLWRRPPAGVLVAVLVTAGLAAWQYLPLAELVPHSIRAHGLGKWEEAEQFLKPQHLPFYLAPGFWGRIFEPGFRPALAWEFIGYVGLLPLVLAWPGSRSPLGRIWLAVAVIGVWGALGERGGLYRLLVHLPGWGAMRAPARLLGFYGLAVCVLAGLGAEEVLAGRWRAVRRGWIVALAAGSALAVVLPPVAGRMVPGSAGSARAALLWMAALGAAAIAWAAGAVNAQSAPPPCQGGGRGRSSPPGGKAAPDGEDPRIIVADEHTEDGSGVVVDGASPCPLLGKEGVPRRHPAAVALAVALVLLDVLLIGRAFAPCRSDTHEMFVGPENRADRVPQYAVGPGRDPALRAFAPDGNLFYAIPTVHNMSPLSLALPVELLDRAAASPDRSALARLWQRLGVAAFATNGRLVPAPLRPAESPWAAAKVTTVRDAEGAVRATLSADLSDAVIVSPPAKAPRAGRGQVGRGPDCQPRPNRSFYTVACPGPELLVLNESAYPGRHAWLDGRPTRLWRANAMQTAVEVPAGRHTIVVAWNPMSLRLGEFLWLLTIAGLAAAVGRKP